MENKINQFADDTACTLKNEESISVLFTLIEKYTIYSGLKLNIDKTVLIWLGPWRNKTNNQLNLQVEKGSFNNLGMYIGRDVKTSIEKNFTDKLTKMKKQFNIWSGRNLTIFGKILISKTFGISNLVYSMTMIDTPIDILENAQKETNKFIWNNKPAKIKHSTLIGKYEWGGAKAVDIKIMQQSLQSVWVSRLWYQTSWNCVITQYLLQYGGIRFLLRCNYDYKDLEIPDFYKNVLRFANNVLVTPHDKEVVWNNKDIRINNKPIFYKHWFEKGVVFIQNLCNEYSDWLNYSQFTLKYNLTNCQLQFMGFIHCLKQLIRNNELYKNINLRHRPQINLDNSIFDTTDGKKIDILKVKSKHFYDILLERNFEPPVACIKWNIEIGLAENDFKLSIKYARMSTSDTRLLCFNFKLLHRLINNNHNLNKWKIKDNSYCELCTDRKIDDTIHALVDCKWTCDKMELLLANLDPNRLIFGNLDWRKWIFGVSDITINLLILIMKMYICQIRGSTKHFFGENFKKTNLFHDTNR